MSDALTRWQFFKSCWADAFAGAWGFWGGAGTVLGTLIPVAIKFAAWTPLKGRSAVTAFLLDPGISDLVWGVPLVLFVVVFAYRLFILAPYHTYRREAERYAALSLHDPRAAHTSDDLRLLGDRLQRFCDERSDHYKACIVESIRQMAAGDVGIRIAGGPGIKSEQSLESETMDIYDQRFANAVMKAQRELRDAGLRGQDLELIGRYPKGLAEIQEIARTMLALAKDDARSPLRLTIANAVAPHLKFSHQDTGTDRYALILIVRVSNSGPPMCLADWQVTVTSQGKSSDLESVILSRDITIPNGGGTYGPKDDIMQKTVETPIATGSIVHGVLLCFSPSPTDILTTHPGRINLSCMDTKGQRHEAVMEWEMGRKGPAFYPGIGRHEPTDSAAS